MTVLRCVRMYLQVCTLAVTYTCMYTHVVYFIPHLLLLLVARSNSANAWRASKYMSIGKDDL